MRVLVAGGTGTLGRPVVERLLAADHEVWATSRSPERVAALEDAGAHGLVMDALDARSTADAVAAAQPDAVVHLLTALPPGGPRSASDLEATNRLRIEGTRNLVRAVTDAGVRRLIAESFAAVYGPGSSEPMSEADPLPQPAGELPAVVAALRSLEEQVRAAGGSVLRYGLFYGPAVPSTQAAIRQLRRRAFPMPGGAPGVASWVHLDDAAAATVAALERATPGDALNVCDDEPVTIGEFFAALAAQVGAPRPMRIPVWLGRRLAPYATRLAVDSRLPMSNARIRASLGWQPAYATYREGLRTIEVRR